MWGRASLAVAAAALAVFPGCGTKETSTEKAIDWIPLEGGGRPDAVYHWAIRVQVKGIKPYLTSKKSFERVTAITALGCLKNHPDATELLVEIAHGKDPNDVLFAVMALGYQGAPEAKPEIERALKHPDPTVRRAACLAIAQYGDKSLYPLLDQAATDPENAVRLGAKTAWHLIQHPVPTNIEK